MIPNNNLSVLPWYTSVDQQNARKWWIYNRVYPLFSPALNILPFQIIRTSRQIPTPGDIISRSRYGNGWISSDGTWHTDEQTFIRYTVDVYDNLSLSSIYIEDAPAAYNGQNAVMGVAFNTNGTVLGTFNPISSGYYTGVWSLPAGTTKIYIQSWTGAAGAPSIKAYVPVMVPRPISLFELYTKEGTLVGNYLSEISNAGLTIKAITAFNQDVIVFPGQLPVFTSRDNGQYYCKISDGIDTWFSEVFTSVNDMVPYVKIEWWDTSDFTMDAGTIVYTNPTFKNMLYLATDIAKPEYVFEDEVEERDGYSFPLKQISKKIYHFNFLASEYLLDVMRFIRMADYAEITSNGQRYSLDSFLITPDWEDNGDVASVNAEFSTATVAKKIGLAYIKAQRGDFNDDFNDDFNNQ